MRKIFLLTNLIVLLCLALACNATEPKYLIHTSAKDIEVKKKQALQWYEDYVNGKKFYTDKQAGELKSKALKWYEDQITKEKFYFVNSEKEIAFTKTKALRWFEKNSQ